MSRTVSRTMDWKSMYVWVVISPKTSTSPVVVAVSQATRASGSSRRIWSRIASEIWSHILSGWPSVTDSDVNRYCAASTMLTSGSISVFGVARRVSPDRRPWTRDVGPGTSCPSPQGLEVKVALDRTKRLVVDDPGVAQADDGLALGHEHGVPDRPVVEQLLLGLVGAGSRPGQHVAGLVLVLLAQLVDQREMARVVVLELL